MKITRSTFTRKALTFGIIVFMSVALIASGFAAWLVSSGSNVEGDGNIKVEVVEQANIEIKIKGLDEHGTLTDARIIFAPDQNDHKGNVQATPGLPQQLSFTVDGEVTNGGKVGTLTFSLKLSDAVCYAAGFVKEGGSWTYKKEKAYIAVPSYAMDSDGNPLPKIVKDQNSFTVDGTTAPVVLTIDANKDLKEGVSEGGFSYKFEDDKYKIEAVYEFGWGEAVQGKNPGESLDGVENKNLPACVKSKEGVYSTDRAELVLRLINAIVSGKKITIPSTDVVDKNAYDVDPTELSDAEVKKYIDELKKMESSMGGATMKVVIQAMPR